MNNKTNQTVKDIMALAMREAEGYDDIKLKPEHIVIAILVHSENETVEALKDMRVDLISLYDTISESLVKSDYRPRVNNHKGDKKLPLTPEVRKVLIGSDKECEDLNETVININHVFLSILNGESNITNLLNNFRITYENFKKIVKQKKDGPTMNEFDNPEEDDLNNIRRNNSARNKQTTGAKSKTPVLDNFCRNISQAATNGEIDPVVGREEEIKRVAQILSRRKKNNPILIGDPGVGKTSVVEGLALMVANGEAPRVLMDKKFYSLDLGLLVAGTKYRGQFEERMKGVLNEAKENKDIILFIDELHTIIGAGNASGSLDASNMVKPALARGELQVIGATTLDEYRENIETDGALTRRFQEVLVEEPSVDETITILTNIKSKYEDYHMVNYTDEAIIECAKLADRYIQDRCMPDKAIDILDEAGAATNISKEIPTEIKELEQKLFEITKKKNEIVKKQQYEDAAKLRDDEKRIEKELQALKDDFANNSNANRVTVDVEGITEIVAMMTGIPVNKISVQENEKLALMEKELCEQIIGQDEAVSKVAKAIKRSRLGIRKHTKPIGSFIFLGPTGVGKTHLAKLIAEYVFGDSDSMVRIDMSEYMEKHSVSKLIGSPPGYVGYEEGGKLTEAVRRKPYSVVLFDEIEKAHPDVFNIMLQLLDEGHLTDALDRKVDFKNCFIILTSNVGVKDLNNFGNTMGFSTPSNIINEENRVKSILDKALKKKFPPEFINRIDETIIFKSLTEEDIQKIIVNEIEDVEERMEELGYFLKLSPDAMKYIAKQGYHKEYGARPLGRAIQRYVEDPIADELIKGNISEGDTIKVGYSTAKDEITVNVTKGTADEDTE